MSDSILVRVTLGSYDFAHPSEKHTQVYVQIPEVARVSYMLPSSRYDGLAGRSWPEVLDLAHEHYAQGWIVSDPTSESARAAVHEWLRDATNRDEMQAAYEADQARQNPVVRTLQARVAELEKANAGLDDLRIRAFDKNETLRGQITELRSRLSAAPSQLTAEQRAALAGHLADAKPARDGLIADMARAIHDRREHDHPQWEDLYCLNLVSWMGERMGPVLRRLLNTEARVAELEAKLAEFERPADEDPIAYALTEQAGGGYPPALPWARLMDADDLAEFLAEVEHAIATPGAAPAEALAAVEKACGTWQVIAEAQHAHNTAPGPGAEMGGSR
ncbi:hypothetical protein [Streptomyces olivaceus]|uniref:hypothetical protein n=1 Tax=Streptomyces olivaceus TaxID=47716 RepID=UPI0037993DAA